MAIFYKWLGLAAIVVAALLTIPAMFSQRDNYAVAFAVVLLIALPAVLSMYWKLVNKKAKGETK